MASLSSSSSSSLKAVLVDLSGTLHVEDDATPGAVEALGRLQSMKDIKLKFVTNTTKESQRVLLERLHRIGFRVDRDDIFSSLSAARRLIDERKLRPFFMVDEKALEDFEGVPQDPPNAVVVGLAPNEFHYDKMNTAMRLLHDGASLMAIHKGKYYKRNDGLALGPGPFITALEYASDVTAEIVGKPSSQFFLSSISEFGVEPVQCVMIGDDVRDDIDGAQRSGMRGILVKTGKYREGDEKKISPPPFAVVDNFSQAVDVIERLV